MSITQHKMLHTLPLVIYLVIITAFNVLISKRRRSLEFKSSTKAQQFSYYVRYT